jgi:hypothetical protein
VADAVIEATSSMKQTAISASSASSNAAFFRWFGLGILVAPPGLSGAMITAIKQTCSPLPSEVDA